MVYKSIPSFIVLGHHVNRNSICYKYSSNSDHFFSYNGVSWLGSKYYVGIEWSKNLSDWEDKNYHLDNKKIIQIIKEKFYKNGI